MGAFTSDTARRARCRKAGLAAARYWREHGFANLERAREQRKRNAALRREERERQEIRQSHTVIFPHGGLHVWYCSCGLTGYAHDTVIAVHHEAEAYSADSAGLHVARVPTITLQ